MYIACIDSGLGGITTLNAMRTIMPAENFIYYADIANNPYGQKSSQQIIDIIEHIISQIKSYQLKAIVLACNTATSAAADYLRAKYSLPILGLEPAIKTALAKVNGKILVLATPLTIAEKKFNLLLKQLDVNRQIIPLSCPNLANLIEDNYQNPQINAYLQNICQPNLANCQAIVLGCTHYIFLKPQLKQLWPHLLLIDGNLGLAKNLAKTISPNNRQQGKIIWLNSLQNSTDNQHYVNKCLAYYQIAGQINN